MSTSKMEIVVRLKKKKLRREKSEAKRISHEQEGGEKTQHALISRGTV